MWTNGICQCDRCGQVIKNRYGFRGKDYGSECIKVVTGEGLDHWVLRNGEIDEEATKQRQAEREAKRLEQKAVEDRIQAECKAAGEWNQQHFADVLAVIGRQARIGSGPADGGQVNEWGQNFCGSMVLQLRHTKLTKLSEQQRAIILEIYAKSFGRGGSKANNKALDEIYERINGLESVKA
jgi:hypothetical protein